MVMSQLLLCVQIPYILRFSIYGLFATFCDILHLFCDIL